uniref:C-type lectin domain-containing protein n=1 Tax=Cyprinodon variegatus TaxID=28743 RepID=A0A3Q2GF86_CYPVA
MFSSLSQSLGPFEAPVLLFYFITSLWISPLVSATFLLIFFTNRMFPTLTEGLLPNSLCSDLYIDEMCLNNRPEWERYQRKCYKFNTRKSSWTESRDSCRDQGGDLVKIDSIYEQIFLEIRLRELMEEKEDKFWIGLTDSKKEGRWLWADGSPLDESFYFSCFCEPDDWKKKNTAGEDCVRMGEKEGADDLKCWFDKFCDVPHKSICEKSFCK